MSNLWLILDANFLCHRAKYTTGGLSYKGNVTGVIYGFLREVIALQEQFDTHKIIFCWDSKLKKRRKIYPTYQGNRKQTNLTKEELTFEKAFRHQIWKLRTEYLSIMGYKNVFHQKGYEADDIIASICKNLPDKDRAIIISADHDLYQLISHNVSVYDPKAHKELTLQGFNIRYGILPTQWAEIKAIAGCTTDNVIGIRGVGEKTAIKYLKGELKFKTQTYQKVISGTAIIGRNLHLILLPYPGTKTFQLKKDKLSKQGWDSVCKKLGFKSIRYSPFTGRKFRNEKGN